MNKTYLARSKGQKATKLTIFLLIILLLSLCCAGLSVVGYKVYNTNYRRDVSLAQVGIQHLEKAETLVKTLSNNPFDSQTVSQAQHEFIAASRAFVQVYDDLQLLPGISTAIPVYGPRLQAALDLLPLAIDLSQAGANGCDALNLLISKFQNPLKASQGLTMADFSTLEKDFHRVKTILDQTIDRFNHMPPDDVQFDQNLSTYFVTIRSEIPLLQTLLQDIEKLLPVVPALLGIGTPSHYLVEILDSTELRPGGGYLGSYGIATVSGGHFISAPITDTALLDNSEEASSNSIPFPSAYSWFDLAPYWGLRDSNLEADFPTSARYAEANYAREGGKVPVQGVVAITPALIEHTLDITGPINVPEYNEIVTSQNLLDRIHYYLIGPGYQGGSVPSPDGMSSVNQHFVAILAEHFMARVRQLSPLALTKMLHLLLSSMYTKDLQIYFNSSIAEHILQTMHVDASIQSPGGDSLFVVDANIGGNKANRLISNTLDDQVTFDTQGNAIHHTSIHYTWVNNDQTYGPLPYRDYVRVYVPPRSILLKQDGWQSRGTGHAFGREVWAGFFTLAHGQPNTVTLVWMNTAAVTKDIRGWHYQYMVQRQAGSQWLVELHVQTPACATITKSWGGLLPSSTGALALTRTLQEDMNIGADYACH